MSLMRPWPGAAGPSHSPFRQMTRVPCRVIFKIELEGFMCSRWTVGCALVLVAIWSSQPATQVAPAARGATVYRRRPTDRRRWQRCHRGFGLRRRAGPVHPGRTPGSGSGSGRRARASTERERPSFPRWSTGTRTSDTRRACRPRSRTTRARTSSITCTGLRTTASPRAWPWARTSATCRTSCGRDILAGKYPDAARFLTAGRGLAPFSEIEHRQHAARGVRGAHRGRCPGRGQGTGLARRDPRQDLGARRPEDVAGPVWSAHRRSAQEQCPCGRPRHGAGGRQGAAAGRHRHLRAHDRRCGRRDGRAVQAASERFGPAIAGSAETGVGVCAVARSARSAAGRDAAGRCTSSCCGIASHPRRRRRASAAWKHGTGKPRAS